MASSVPPVALRFPHEIEEWNDGQSHVCKLAVTMPDGSTESFRGKGQSARAARANATFSANFAINLHAFNDGDSNYSTDNGNPVQAHKQPPRNSLPQHASVASVAGERPVEIDPTLMEVEESGRGKRRNVRQKTSPPPPLQSTLRTRYDSSAPSHDKPSVTPVQAKLTTFVASAPPVAFCEPHNDPTNDSLRPPEPQFVEADESPKILRNNSLQVMPQSVLPGDETTATPKEGRKPTNVTRNAYSLVAAESSGGESSGDESEDFGAVCPPSNKLRRVEKASSTTQRHMEHPRSNTVDRKQSPVTRSAPVSADLKKTRDASTPKLAMHVDEADTVKPTRSLKRKALSMPSERVEPAGIRELITYSDDDDDNTPPAQKPLQFQDSRPSEIPHSPLEQGQILDSDDPSPPGWLKEYKFRQHHDPGTFASKISQQAGRSLSHNQAFRAGGKTGVEPNFRSDHSREPHVTEPCAPSSDKRQGAVFSGGNSAARYPQSSSQPVRNSNYRNTTEGAKPYPGPVLQKEDRTGSMNQATPLWMARALRTASPNANATRARSNMPSSRRGQGSLRASHGRRWTAPGTGVISTPAGMNETPVAPPVSFTSIPLPPHSQVPSQPPHGPIFPDPRFVGSEQNFSPPFPVVPPPFLPGPLQQRQFPQLPHTLPGPLMYGPSIGGASFPFGPSSKQDIEANLASIRRAAIANAQAAVEKDLRNSIQAGSTRGPGSGTYARNAKKSDSKDLQVAADPSLHRYQTNINTEIEKSEKRGRSHLKSHRKAACKQLRTDEGGDHETEQRKRTAQGQTAARGSGLLARANPANQECDTGVIEHSSGDEIDGGEHISALHELVQRIKACKSLQYHFDRSWQEKRSWICTVRVTRTHEDVEDKPLEVKISSRTKQMAKRKASKKMFTVLQEMLAGGNMGLKQARPATVTNVSQAKAPPKLPAGGHSSTTAAVGALNELWLCKTLENQPDARLQAVDGAKWKCTFLLKVANHGLVRVSEEGSSKKVAKRFAAHKALDVLKKLPGSGAGRFSLVKSLAEAREAEAASLEELPEEQKEAAMEDAVKMSDDEDYVAQKQEHFDDTDGLFVLPRGYVLTIARSGADCELWVEKHLKKESDIGFFLTGGKTPLGNGVGLDPNSDNKDKRKASAGIAVICLSSNEAGLVLRADMCQDSEGKDSDVFDGLWLPGAVRSVLRNRNLWKHGHEFDLAMVALWEEHGIRARGMNDVAITSFAVNGFSRSYGNKVLWTIPELNKYWLQKEGVAKSWRGLWADRDDAPDLLKENGNFELGVAALYAYGCLQINERVKAAGKRKRALIYGASGEFAELSRRLMRCPFPQSR